MLTNVIHRWNEILRLKSGYKILPHFVDFHTSNLCNQHCNGCAYSDVINGSYMDASKHLRAVDMFLDLAVDAFDFAGGGEPTLIPYLGDLLKYIREKNAHYALITNGSNLKEDIVQALLWGGTYVRISLEASCEEDHKKYKGENVIDWTDLLCNIKNLVSMRDKSKSDLEISIKFSVSKSFRGEEHYQRIFKIADSLNIDRVVVKCLRHEPEELSIEERTKEFGYFMKAMPKGRRYKIVDSILPWHSIPQCWLNPLHTVMDHLGNLYICCYYYFRENDFLIGNIFEESFEDIWLSPSHLDKIRRINPQSCAKVDCKFFAHHKAVDEMLKRGQVYFL